MTVAFAVASRRERVELELVEQVEEVRASHSRFRLRPTETARRTPAPSCRSGAVRSPPGEEP